jgi:hypothetical protein
MRKVDGIQDLHPVATAHTGHRGSEIAGTVQERRAASSNGEQKRQRPVTAVMFYVHHFARKFFDR